MQSNPDLLQGELIVKEGKPSIPIPDGYVAVLSSGYGIEGIYTKEDIIQLHVEQLRALGAYRNEDLAVLVRPLNDVV